MDKHAVLIGREKEEELQASGVAPGGRGPARHLMLWGPCVTGLCVLLNWSELPGPFAKPRSSQELCRASAWLRPALGSAPLISGAAPSLRR